MKDQEIKSPKDGEFDNFLGKPVGFQITRDMKELARLMDTENKILHSKLASWQR
jgi:hypothetical protein